MAKTKVQWSGVLGEPLGPRPTKPRKGLLDEEVWDDDSAEGKQWNKGFLDRLVAIAIRYKIATSRPWEEFWQLLALSLADEFVPGFSQRNPTKRGPKGKHDTAEARAARQELLAALEAKLTDPKTGDLGSAKGRTASILQRMSKKPTSLPSWFRTNGHGYKSLANAVNRARSERETRLAIARMLASPTGLGFTTSGSPGGPGLLGSMPAAKDGKSS